MRAMLRNLWAASMYGVLLAAPVVASAQDAAPADLDEQARQAAQAAKDAAKAVEMVEAAIEAAGGTLSRLGAFSCSGETCHPQELVGRYCVASGPFTRSEMRLDANGRYEGVLESAPMFRRTSGRWYVHTGGVVLEPLKPLTDSLQLVSPQMLEMKGSGQPETSCGALLRDAEDGLAQRRGAAEALVWLEEVHTPGEPVLVVLKDPLSGVATEGVELALELARGEIPATESFMGGNEYFFELPVDHGNVRALVLRSPALHAPVRMPLDGPLRARYALLFDGCDIGLCYSRGMLIMPERRENAWVLDASGVGVFIREDNLPGH